MKLKYYKKIFALTGIITIILSCKNESLSLKQPESVVASDEFMYVSNINGSPTDRDNNGYISKLYANGKVCENKFITGLNAPKGLCLVKHILFVTDMDKILGFNIITKEKVFECSFQKYQTQFLNDICFDGHQNLFVSATDINEIFQLNIINKTITPLHLMSKLNGPNGVVYSNHTLYVCELGNDSIKGGICKVEFAKDFYAFSRLENNMGYLDGLILLNDRLYFSDWVSFNPDEKNACIWAYDLKTKERVPVKTSENMSGCADIAYDLKNNRIVAPLMNQNKVIFIPL